MHRFCCPGTKLEKRLARGDTGINPLDSACKEHDIAYSENQSDIQARNIADQVLADKAWQRVKSKDASFGEKAAALAVTNIMKAKSKMGMGVKRKSNKKRKTRGKKKGRRVAFGRIVKATKKLMSKSNNAKTVIKSALKVARKAVKKNGGKSKINKLRVLPLPYKVGGVSPLTPIFAGLSAIGALAGGMSGVAKAVNDVSNAKKQLEEAKRHNQAMEQVALGKGLYLRPYKGSGLRLHNENVMFGKKKHQFKFTIKAANKYRH